MTDLYDDNDDRDDRSFLTDLWDVCYRHLPNRPRSLIDHSAFRIRSIRRVVSTWKGKRQCRRTGAHILPIKWMPRRSEVGEGGGITVIGGMVAPISTYDIFSFLSPALLCTRCGTPVDSYEEREIPTIHTSLPMFRAERGGIHFLTPPAPPR